MICIFFFSDESDEENAEERKKKEKENRRKKKQEEAAALKQTKKPRRHRLKGRRYYDSDHDADESELASESEIIGMPITLLRKCQSSSSMT